jgi:hypothetical protein
MLYFLSREPLVFPGEPGFNYRQNVKDKIKNIIDEDITDNNEINDLRIKLDSLPEPTPLDENFVNSFMLPIRFAFSKIGSGQKFNEYQSYFKSYLNDKLIKKIQKYEELVTNLIGISDWAGVTGVIGTTGWTNPTGAGWTGVTNDMYLVNRQPFDFSDNNINTSYLDLNSKEASGNLLLATFNCNKDIDTVKTFATTLDTSETDVNAFFNVKNVYRNVVTSYGANVKGYDTPGCVGCTGCMTLEESKASSGSATRGRRRGGGRGGARPKE